MAEIVPSGYVDGCSLCRCALQMEIGKWNVLHTAPNVPMTDGVLNTLPHFNSHSSWTEAIRTPADRFVRVLACGGIYPKCEICDCDFDGHVHSKKHFKKLWWDKISNDGKRENYWYQVQMRLSGLDEVLTVRFNNADFEVQICRGRPWPQSTPPMLHAKSQPPPPPPPPPPPRSPTSSAGTIPPPPPWSPQDPRNRLQAAAPANLGMMEATFDVGDRVVVHSVVTMPELNGVEGKITDFKNNRLVVELQGVQGSKALLPRSLRRLDRDDPPHPLPPKTPPQESKLRTPLSLPHAEPPHWPPPPPKSTSSLPHAKLQQQPPPPPPKSQPVAEAAQPPTVANSEPLPSGPAFKAPPPAFKAPPPAFKAPPPAFKAAPPAFKAPPPAFKAPPSDFKAPTPKPPKTPSQFKETSSRYSTAVAIAEDAPQSPRAKKERADANGWTLKNGRWEKDEQIAELAQQVVAKDEQIIELTKQVRQRVDQPSQPGIVPLLVCRDEFHHSEHTPPEHFLYSCADQSSVLAQKNPPQGSSPEWF